MASDNDKSSNNYNLDGSLKKSRKQGSDNIAMDILLEESTTEKVPQKLERIIKNVSTPHKAPDSIQKDYLFILLLVSMIESEFVLVNNDCELLDHTLITAETIAKWKSSAGVYEVSLIMNNFKSTPVKLIMSPLGAMVLVNVLIKDFEAETYSVCIPVSKYVVSPQAATIPKIFRDLKHFSMMFKSKVSAVKSRILNYYGIVSASILGLPEELIFKILLYLPVNAAVNMSRSCMSLRNILQSERFWHNMVNRDFKSADLSAISDHDWKELYKTSYISQRDKETLIRRAARNMHDYMDHADYVAYVDNPMWHNY